MLKQILNIDLSVNELMLGIILFLGLIVVVKFIKTIIRIRSFRKNTNEPVYKNLIKKTSDI